MTRPLPAFKRWTSLRIDCNSSPSICSIPKWPIASCANTLRALELKKRAKEEEIADWNDLIPEGYALWQPEKGNLFYTGLSVPERAINKLLARGKYYMAFNLYHRSLKGCIQSFSKLNIIP